MHFPLIKPTGNLAAIEPALVVVQPIAAVAVAVGDIVQFDLTASDTTYTSAAALEDYDNKKCPFNVVIAGAAVTADKEGGVWGVVLEAAAAGNRCKVAIHGVVTAAVVSGATAIAKGNVLMPVANRDLGLATNGANPVVAIALEAGTANATANIKVLFNGYQFGAPAV